MSFLSSFGQPATTAAITPVDEPADPKADQVPSDTISSLAWAPNANFLVATSWDKSIRCWEIGAMGVQPRAMKEQPKPLLCSAWNAAGTQIFFGGCEGKALQWDLATDQVIQVAQHQAPIKDMVFVPLHNCLVTGSWDRSLLFWDLRSPNPIHRFDLGERCYAMAYRDASQQGGGNMLVAATADRPQSTPSIGGTSSGNVHPVWVFDMRNPTSPPTSLQSPLSYSTRCLEVFHDAKGFFLGSIEGRVNVQYHPEAYANNAKKSFTFKCHRVDRDQPPPTTSFTSDRSSKPEKPQDAYPVNAVTVHPEIGTFATAGSDGRVCFWDKDNRSNLNKIGNPRGGKTLTPVTACKFNANGSLIAYARGYDWHMGPPAPNAAYPVELMIRAVAEKDIKPKTQIGR